MKNFRITQMSPQLRVTDVERSIEFYTKQLGFELEFRYEDFYAGIIKDGYSIHLKLTDQPKAQKQQDDDASLELMFSVEHIQDLYKELPNRAVQIIQPLRQMPYGSEFYIADPDGNVIALFENTNTD